MDQNQELELIRALTVGEQLNVHSAAVAVLPSSDGAHSILLSMVDREGKRYVVPIGRDLALRLGDAMVRAVDAIDAGSAPISQIPVKNVPSSSAPVDMETAGAEKMPPPQEA